MKKLLLSLLIFPVAVSATRLPDVWHSSSLQGWTEYSISDSKGQVLWIACNLFEDEYGTHLELNNKNIDGNELAFLIDGNAYYANNSDTTNGINQWAKFTHAISKGKLIEIYHQNKKVVTFKPTKQSIKKIASDIRGC